MTRQLTAAPLSAIPLGPEDLRALCYARARALHGAAIAVHNDDAHARVLATAAELATAFDPAAGIDTFRDVLSYGVGATAKEIIETGRAAHKFIAGSEPTSVSP